MNGVGAGVMEKSVRSEGGEMTEEQFDKLPKYAQEHIRILSMRLDEARNQLDEYLEKYPGYPKVVVNAYSDYKNELPGDTIVKFALGDRRSYSVRLYEDNRLVVRAMEEVNIIPCAANTFEVEMRQ